VGSIESYIEKIYENTKAHRSQADFP